MKIAKIMEIVDKFATNNVQHILIVETEDFKNPIIIDKHRVRRAFVCD